MIELRAPLIQGWCGVIAYVMCDFGRSRFVYEEKGPAKENVVRRMLVTGDANREALCH